MKIRRYLQIKRIAELYRQHALDCHRHSVEEEVREDGERLLTLASYIDELCQLIETEENEDA